MVELCGSWDHDGPCRWPHHTATTCQGTECVVRTVFAVDGDEADAITTRINQSLARDPKWRVVEWGRVEPTAPERQMGERRPLDRL